MLSATMHLGIVAVSILVFNLPFGYWRAHTPRYSLQWFLAIHLPVIAAIALRVSGALGWKLNTFPTVIAAFCLGQFLGGKIHDLWQRRGASSISACLVCDLWRRLRT